MRPVDRARAVAGWGLEGNANQGGFRQITILSRESWDAASAAVGTEVPPEVRRANLLVSGVGLEHSRRKVLAIGELRVLVMGETRPCRLMEESCSGLLRALEPGWRGGVFGRVCNDAGIAVGDPVCWADD